MTKGQTSTAGFFSSLGYDDEINGNDRKDSEDIIMLIYFDQRQKEREKQQREKQRERVDEKDIQRGKER